MSKQARSGLVCIGIVLFTAAPILAQVPLIRDSAGVRIVENPALPLVAPAPIVVARDPTLQIGVLEGPPEYQFQDIAAATRLHNGDLVVADRGTGEIRIFDKSGRFVRKIGRKGGGPGEFERLSYITALPGDSLFAWDASGGRFTIFSSSGGVTRTFRAANVSGEPPIYVGYLRGLLGDGSFFGYRTGRVPPPSEKSITRDTMIVRLFTRDGKFVTEIGRFLGLEIIAHTGGAMPDPKGILRPTYSIQGVPFARETHFAVSGNWLYAGDGGNGYEIKSFDHTGFLKQIIRVRGPLSQVTSSVIALHRKIPHGRGTPMRPAPSPTLDRSFYPSTIPAYADMRVDAMQRLWVMDYPTPGDTQSRWNVFDESGILLGSVVTPQGIRVLEIGADYLLGVWRDDLDVEYIRVHKMAAVTGR